MAWSAGQSRSVTHRLADRSFPSVRPDLLRGCLALLMILSISRIHQRYAWMAAFRPGLTLTGLAILIAFMKPHALADTAWTRQWPARAVAGISAVTITSMAFGISQGGSYLFFSDIVFKVYVVCFLLMAAIRDPRDLRVFVWAYVIGTAILAWMALFVFKMVAERNGVTRLSNLDTWDANDVCVLMLIGLPLCLLLIRTSQAKGRLGAMVVAAGIGAVIARSGSRGGFLGLVCVLLAYLLSMKGAAKARGLAISVLLGIALLIAAPTGYWAQMNTITSAKDDYNWSAIQGRRQLAIRGMGYMLSYPFFGIGVGNFGRAEGTLSPFAGQKGIRWSAPHNTYVQAGAELGIPGLLLFIGLIGGCVVVPWRLRQQLPAAWENGTWNEQFVFQAAIYFPIAAVGFAVPAYFVSFAYTDPPYIVAALTSALLVCVARMRSTEAMAAPSARVPERVAGCPVGSRPRPRNAASVTHKARIRWAPIPPADPPASSS